jgi:ATP-dependent DNA helicase RecG
MRSCTGHMRTLIPRNPTLAEVLRGLGYVQRFGAGIPLIRSSLTKNQNPEPRFEATDTHVAVTIWGRP